MASRSGRLLRAAGYAGGASVAGAGVLYFVRGIQSQWAWWKGRWSRALAYAPSSYSSSTSLMRAYRYIDPDLSPV